MKRAPLSLVVAIAKNHVIGRAGQLPWDLPEDRRHFRAVTTGHAVILGRRTYEEIGRPLPNRRNIVVSRTPGLALPGCEVAASLGDAIALARATDDEPRVIGGAALYREALPLATKIYLTEVDLEPEGDVQFELDRAGFVELERKKGEDPRVTFVLLARTDA
ncbi:MAG TPA: dihydrofolate reductase [Minicystis sp.]|nr:dihydrofolate reductase [Minicystis sp.]